MDGNFFGSRKLLLLAGAVVALGASVAPGWAIETTAETGPELAESFDATLPRFEPAADTAPADLGMAQAETDDEWTQYGSGMASYYASKFDGRRTASGERFDNDEYTAAHRTLPFGTRVRLSRNGRDVVVRINDRGPFTRGREIDVSQAAARDLGLIGPGHGRVTLAVFDDRNS
ncbi:septal ring lytic transglycosylase RlpA family protein [Tsuneonella sp. HG222]